MPYITSMFMPRAKGDRPAPVPSCARNLAFVSQFVEIPEDQLLNIKREIPPILHHDKSLKVNFDAVIKAFQ